LLTKGMESINLWPLKDCLRSGALSTKKEEREKKGGSRGGDGIKWRTVAVEIKLHKVGQ